MRMLFPFYIIPSLLLAGHVFAAATTTTNITDVNIAAADWIVFPVEGITTTQEDAATSSIRAIAGPENVFTVRSDLDSKVVYWLAHASRPQVVAINRIENVYPAEVNDRMIGDDEENTFVAVNGTQDDPSNSTMRHAPAGFFNGSDSNGKVLVQYPAPPELVVTSWPVGVPLVNDVDIRQFPFYYLAPAWRQVDVYILDQGVNIRHADFTRVPYQIIPRQGGTAKTTDPTGHGTCIASKVVGVKNGLAKNAKLFVVEESETMASSLDSIRVLSETIRPVDSTGRPAVIIITVSTQEAYPLDSWQNPERKWKAYSRYLNILRDKGVVIVMAAGNDGRRSQIIDTYPGLLAEMPDSPIIIVGSANHRGTGQPSSQFPRRFGPIWAPGKNIACASARDFTSIVASSGTSFAAGMVGGIVAYILGNAPTPWHQLVPASSMSARVRDFLRISASRRMTGTETGSQAIITNQFPHFFAPDVSESNQTGTHHVAPAAQTFQVS